MSTGSRRRLGCVERKRDRWGTLHDCELPAGHSGRHRSPDGLSWFGPCGDSGWERAHEIIRAECFSTRQATALIRELAEVRLAKVTDAQHGALEVMVNGIPSVLQAGDWVVLLDDGEVRIYDALSFAREFRPTRTA